VKSERLRFWLPVAVTFLGGLGLVVPGSPLSLPDLLAPGRTYEGRSPESWARDLTSADAEVRHEAIRAIGTFGDDAAEAVPALAGLLESPSPADRQLASFALTKMAPASQAAVGALARALSDDVVEVRMNAALALCRLGQAARPAVPALIAALRRRDNGARVGQFSLNVREMTAVALGRASAGTAEGTAALTEALREARTEGSRVAAARALGEVGPAARPAVPSLRALLGAGQSDEVEQAAREALGKIEGGAGPT
jgi:HEAT repeat protein